MRIIGGIFKGRSLVSPGGNTVRPTADRTKEAIFNLIQFEVKDKAVLDLFAGSGALGIEAISRGASSATFCDISKGSVEAVEQNLKKISGNFQIVNKDYKGAIKSLAIRGNKFDIIFLDPPYGKGFIEDCLKLIEANSILSDNGLIIVERKNDENDYKLPESLAIIDSRCYGIAKIELLKKATKAAITGTFDPFTNGHTFLVTKALESFDYIYVTILNNPDKVMTYSLENRIKMMEKVLRPYKNRVQINYYDGLTIDFCKKNGIKYIIRGFRNQTDFEYETEMAKFNQENGNITTILIPAADNEISSTLIKEKLDKDENIEDFVDIAILKDIKKRR